MNVQRQIEKLEKLAEAAYKSGAYRCARKWDLKREKLEAVVSALETVEEPRVMYNMIQVYTSTEAVVVDRNTNMAYVMRPASYFMIKKFNAVGVDLRMVMFDRMRTAESLEDGSDEHKAVMAAIGWQKPYLVAYSETANYPQGYEIAKQGVF